jgi:DNA-binding NtrC family response regulator
MKKKNKFIIAGEEILEYLMKINPDVKVILASGYDMNEKIQGMMQKGCKEFVQKPYDIRVVSMKIRKVLDR